MTTTARTETRGTYSFAPLPADARTSEQEDAIIAEALAILDARYQPGAKMNNPADVRDYLKLELASLEHEVFGAVWLDCHNRVIDKRRLFTGTLNEVAIHAREVVKEGLWHNAAAVVFYHNHPSGASEPSEADRQVTELLAKILDVVGISVLDHLVVGRDGVTSLAEHCLI